MSILYNVWPANAADREPDNLQPAARGLRQLLVLALQPRLRVRRAARAQRSVPASHFSIYTDII